MASGDHKSTESTAEVGAADQGAGKGGCGCLELGKDLLGDGTVGNVVRVGDVGD